MHAEPQTDFQELLVRGLAHRMNNILSVFHGYVGLMLDNEGLDPATRDGLTRIKAGARAATELMDRTHSLVRQPTVVWREIDLPQLVRMLRPAIDAFCKPRVTLEFVAPDEMPLVWADSGRLRTAILELVRNACEATAPAGGTVQVVLSSDTPIDAAELSSALQPTRWVSLAVLDNGPGIAPEIAHKVFQPFFSTKRKHDANGLGLNVAQGLIQQCGGILRHESRRGATKFEILLPARAAV